MNASNYSNDYGIAAMDMYFDCCEYTDLEMNDAIYNLFNMGSEI